MRLFKFFSIRFMSIFVILSVGVYTLIVRDKGSSLLWEWLNAFMSIILSLLLAVVSEIKINEHLDKNKDKKKKEKFLYLLKVEINDIRETFNNTPDYTINIEGFNYAWIVYQFKTVILEEIFKSGLFDNEDEIEKLTLQISREINIYNVQNNNILNGINQPKKLWNNETLRLLIERCNKTKKLILEYIDDLDALIKD